MKEKRVDVSSKPYVELFDELLIPEGFFRKGKIYFKAIPENNILQIFERFPSNNMMYMNFILTIVHACLGVEIELSSIRRDGVTERLNNISGRLGWYEQFDFKKLYDTQYESDEEKIEDMAKMMRRSMTEARDDMRDFGLPYFDKYNNAEKLSENHIVVEQWAGRGSFPLFAYTLKPEKAIPSVMYGISDNRIADTEKRIADANKELKRGNLSKRKGAELEEDLEAYINVLASGKRVTEEYKNILNMIETNDIAGMRKMLEENERITRESIKKVLKIDMPPLDLDEWERKMRAL